MSLPPQSVSATTSGAAIDFQQGDLPVQCIGSIGALSGGANTVTFSAQESATGTGGWITVATTSPVIVGLTVANTLVKFYYLRTLRYGRLVATLLNATGVLVYGYMFCMGVETGVGGGSSLSPQV